MTPTDPLLLFHAGVERIDREVGSLEARLERLDRDITAARTTIEARYRHEHYGRDPIRPFAWTVARAPAAAGRPLPRRAPRPVPRPRRAPAAA